MPFGPAEKHLMKVCPAMKKHVPNHEPYPTEFTRFKDPYKALIRAVVYQQLSGKAAGTIYGRVIALFPNKTHPDPEDILAAKDETFRAAGLSRQKIAAIRDIAQKRLDKIVPHQRSIAHLPDAEIIERLTQVKGVGRWTVEMYLMFSLGRPDVLPVDDLGVRKGASRMLGREIDIKTLGEYGARWAPWRSAAAWHCWRAAETVLMDT
ncbi:MAG: DNA-3-methyladenine glycosylase 2 family protein [Alphaproteobacteria bacterium]|nr:DNA-3-methyladenine glycosylase 2 family protein [Alphaproteobacteria bacterium]